MKRLPAWSLLLNTLVLGLSACGSDGDDTSESALSPEQQEATNGERSADDGQGERSGDEGQGEPQLDEAGEPQLGQSGSEFFEPDPIGAPANPGEGMPQAALYLDCPCERLAGSVPLRGTVVSWESSLLDLEVSEVLVQDPPGNAPVVGQHVLGVYVGLMPCYAGDYLPKPGDAVVGFLVQEQALRNLCCDDCEAQCSVEGGDVSDSCLADCQGPAREACETEREELPIAGQILLAPVQGESVLLATSPEDDYSVELDELATVFEGGEACEAAVGSAMNALPNATFGGSWLWRESCGE